MLRGQRRWSIGGRGVNIRLRATEARLSESDERGACVNCGTPGTIGAACDNAVCERRAYHVVPAEYASRHGGPAPIDPFLGQMVDDYLLVDVLGAGGFGTVYLALSLPIGLKTAVKLLGRAHAQQLDRTVLARMESEARALAKLSHPHIVRLLKFGTHGGRPFLAMEYVDGGRTLGDALAQGKMPPARLGAIVRQITLGLEAAHKRGIVHRDIKPENVMLQAVEGNPDFVRLLDFGLAKSLEEGTETSVLSGTPIYMAPEQVTRRGLGPWTDLYAVGVVAYEGLTGRRPFRGTSHPEIMAAKTDPEYDPTGPIAELALPEATLAFLRKALARDPEDRFRSAKALREALGPALSAMEGSEVVAEAPSGPALGLVDTVAAELPTPAVAPIGTMAEGEEPAPDAGSGVPWLALVGLLVAGTAAALWAWPSGSSEPAVPAEMVDAVARGPEDVAPPAPEDAGPAEVVRPEVSVVQTPPEKACRAFGAPCPAGFSCTEAGTCESEDMVAVPGGPFTMGCHPSEGEGEGSACGEDERPAHPVELDAFALDRTPVTLADWRRCMADRACTPPKRYEAGERHAQFCNWGQPEREDHPVNCVTWFQAVAYCRYRGKRLPTEAEWEKAARGTDGRRYPWGDEAPTCERAVMRDGQGKGCGTRGTLPVGTRPLDASPYGARDMLGNVWEWMEDWYAEGAYGEGPRKNPRGPAEGEDRGGRGGAFISGPDELRVSDRGHDVPETALGGLGVRCAKDLR